MQTSQPLLRHTELRAIEQQHTHSQPPLMERAGQAAATWVLQLLPTTSPPSQTPILILAGPGNNGGDAFVVARHLYLTGFRPHMVFAGHPERLPTDARLAYAQWISAGGTVIDAFENLPDLPASADAFALIIDGLLGIGLQRPVEGHFAMLIQRISTYNAPILALDIPSGLDSETGRVLGCAVRATHTLSFIALKPGLLTLDGPDYCGITRVDDLGLGNLLPSFEQGSTVGLDLCTSQRKPRPNNSHKGSHGNACIIGGARGMTGAALLAGRAALMLGAGRVYVGLLEELKVDPLQAELMLRHIDSDGDATQYEELFQLATCIAIGPGLGQSACALELLRCALETNLPLLIDADALNLLALHPVLKTRLKHRNTNNNDSVLTPNIPPTLLTPHPAEAARLLGGDITEIQNNRVHSALKLARDYHAAILLKGCGSIIAFPDGRWYINTTGNPGLASAGTGDVLSGMTLALLAQGWPSDQALLAAVHLHGMAADACVASGIGPIGLLASELLPSARSCLNQWISSSSIDPN